jgi:N-acetyl-gamma-glutamylphosphate reductase
MKENISVVMLGASGAVGGQVLATLRAMPTLDRISLLGRRNIALNALPALTESPERSSAFSAPSAAISQHRVDVWVTQSHTRACCPVTRRRCAHWAWANRQKWAKRILCALIVIG